MGIAFVQQVGGTSGTTAGQTSLTSTATTFTAGNLLIAVVSWSLSGTGTPSIGTPSGWSNGTSLKNGAINGVAWVGILPNNPGGSQSWTWTLTPGGMTALEWAWTIFEFSGAATTAPLDLALVSAATGSSASTTLNTGAASGTTQAGDLLIELAGFQHGSALTFSSSASSVPSSGWTVATTYESTGTSPYCGVIAQYQVASGTVTNPDGVLTASVSTSSEAFLLTILAASGSTLTWTVADSETTSDSAVWTLTPTDADSETAGEASSFAYAPVLPADAETTTDSLAATLTPTFADSETTSDGATGTFTYSAGDTQVGTDTLLGALTPVFADTEVVAPDTWAVGAVVWTPAADTQTLADAVAATIVWTAPPESETVTDGWTAALSGGLLWTATDSQTSLDGATWTAGWALTPADAQTSQDGSLMTVLYAPPADRQSVAPETLAVVLISTAIDVLTVTESGTFVLSWLPAGDRETDTDAGTMTLLSGLVTPALTLVVRLRDGVRVLRVRDGRQVAALRDGVRAVRIR
jgi:hypothetical protein